MKFDPLYHSLSEENKILFTAYLNELISSGISFIDKKNTSLFYQAEKKITQFLKIKNSPKFLVSLNRDLISMINTKKEITFRHAYEEYISEIKIRYSGCEDNEAMPRLKALHYIHDINADHLKWLIKLDNDISPLLKNYKNDDHYLAFIFLFDLGDADISFDEFLYALHSRPSKYQFFDIYEYSYWISQSKNKYIISKNTKEYLNMCSSYVKIRNNGKDHYSSSLSIIEDLKIHPLYTDQISEELYSLPINNI
jgi:hypothetical protein